MPVERLIWTDALLPGFRPAPAPSSSCFIGGFFTAIIMLKPEGKGTRYIARSLHGDEAPRKKHEETGFHDGWGKALDQLVAHARTT
jgi:uncharacterized protein YndB with AHSA1/START domain